MRSLILALAVILPFAGARTCFSHGAAATSGDQCCSFMVTSEGRCCYPSGTIPPITGVGKAKKLPSPRLCCSGKFATGGRVCEAQHVSEAQSGIVAHHRDKIELACKKLNTMIIVRPTEAASRKLIEQDFATKSLDIHDKSSNWGPMSGFVPLDPGLSKKWALNTVDPNIFQAKLDKIKEHKETTIPIHLKITSAILDEVPDKVLTTGSLEGITFLLEEESAREVGAPVPVTPATFRRLALTTKKPSTDVNLYSITFIIDAGFYVWWVESVSGREDKAHPVWVWAYKQGQKWVAVTGDYDLWMVIPHINSPDLIQDGADIVKPRLDGEEVQVVPTVKVAQSPPPIIELVNIINFRNKHGVTQLTLWIKKLLYYLNQECDRQENPVFNHGAEAQNFDFVQDLDQRVVVFTPSGESLFISIWSLPFWLARMNRLGYIILPNKNYDLSDPRLGGKQRKDLQLISANVGKLEADNLATEIPKIKLELKDLNDQISSSFDLARFAKQLNKHTVRAIEWTSDDEAVQRRTCELPSQCRKIPVDAFLKLIDFQRAMVQGAAVYISSHFLAAAVEVYQQEGHWLVGATAEKHLTVIKTSNTETLDQMIKTLLQVGKIGIAFIKQGPHNLVVMTCPGCETPAILPTEKPFKPAVVPCIMDSQPKTCFDSFSSRKLFFDRLKNRLVDSPLFNQHVASPRFVEIIKGGVIVEKDIKNAISTATAFFIEQSGVSSLATSVFLEQPIPDFAGDELDFEEDVDEDTQAERELETAIGDQDDDESVGTADEDEHPSKAVEPEASKAVEPEASKAVEPEASKAVEPEASKAEPEASKAVEPEASKAVEPEASKAEPTKQTIPFLFSRKNKRLKTHVLHALPGSRHPSIRSYADNYDQPVDEDTEVPAQSKRHHVRHRRHVSQDEEA